MAHLHAEVVVLSWHDVGRDVDGLRGASDVVVPDRMVIERDVGKGPDALEAQEERFPAEVGRTECLFKECFAVQVAVFALLCAIVIVEVDGD